MVPICPFKDLYWAFYFRQSEGKQWAEGSNWLSPRPSIAHFAYFLELGLVALHCFAISVHLFIGFFVLIYTRYIQSDSLIQYLWCLPAIYRVVSNILLLPRCLSYYPRLFFLFNNSFVLAFKERKKHTMKVDLASFSC